MSIADLMAEWEKSDLDLATSLDQYSSDLADLGARLREHVDSLPRHSDGRIAAEMSLEKINAMLAEAGWQGMIKPLRSLMGDVAAGQGGILEILGMSAEPSSKAINVALDFSLIEMKTIKADLASSLLSALQLATTTPITRKTLLDTVQEATEGKRHQARTIADTAASGLQRQVATQAMDQLPAGPKYYLYLGPDDGKTRPFCKRYVGMAIPQSQITKLRNGSKLPVLRFGGGYNCRHSLIPITERIRKQRNIPIARAR